MFNAHVDYGFDVVIVQGIDNGFTLLTIFDKSRVFEDSELVGDCRHTHAQLFGDVADAHFAFEKEIEYFNACAVAHDREKFG